MAFLFFGLELVIRLIIWYWLVNIISDYGTLYWASFCISTPLLLLGGIALVIVIFISAGKKTTLPPPPTTTTTTLPTDVAAFLVTLDIYENQLSAFQADVVAINEDWEASQITFEGALDSFGEVRAAIPSWEDEVTFLILPIDVTAFSTGSLTSVSISLGPAPA